MTKPHPIEVPICVHCKMPAEFRKEPGSSGTRIMAWCDSCELPATPRRPFYPVVRFTKEQLEALEWMPRAPAQEKCSVCLGRFDELENHHTAPQAVFGEESELWPIARVCRGCHEMWHRKMGCPIGEHGKDRD